MCDIGFGSSEMSTDRSREAFGRFLDYLGDKGLMSPSTAQTRKVSAMKILRILESDEAADVTKIDIDDLVRRFSNLHGQSYSPGSVTTYQSRLKSAMADFRSYLENPLAFMPSINGRERPSKSRKENGDSIKGSRSEAQPEPVRQPVQPPIGGTNIMPIPIRADLTILIHGLPHDLTEAEAKKISGVINALAASA